MKELEKVDYITENWSPYKVNIKLHILDIQINELIGQKLRYLA